MPEPWYSIVSAETRITQGDLIANCPLIGWKEDHQIQLNGADEAEVLRHSSEAVLLDAVVMTQACDLEHNKVRHVVLCPHVPLSKFREKWEQAMHRLGQNLTVKAWANTCNDITAGHSWNQSFLNRFNNEPRMDLRVVDFHEVHTIPREFLQALLANRNVSRLRLLPPYREHLSQGFARFFMRVGLPVGIPKEKLRGAP